MPNPDISEIISETIKSTKEDKSKESPAETGAEIKTGKEEEIPAFIKDIDLSDLPENARQKVIEKAKQLYSDYQKKTTELSERRKKIEAIEEIVDEMEQDPKLKEKVSKIYYTHKAGIEEIVDKKAEAKKLFDKLIEDTYDPAAKSALGQLRQAIKEDVDVEDLRKQFYEMNQILKNLSTNNMLSHQEQLEQQIQKLPDAFKDLGEKYKNPIIKLGMQYPSLQVKKLLQLVAIDEEYETAVFNDKQKQLKKEIIKTKETATTKSTGALGIEGIGKESQILSKSKMFGSKWNIGKLIEKVFPEAKSGLPT